jgi:hypothetical protein
LTLWVSEDLLWGWHDDKRTGRPDAPRTYSDTVILYIAWLSVVYRLTLRSTIDLVASLMKLLNAELPVPHSTTLCRWRRKLAVNLPRAKGDPLHLVVDVTGSKVYDEGEWKVRSHGWCKRRAWPKLNVGVGEVSGEIVVPAAVTSNDLDDGQLLPELLD